jgi:hypothetical protein
LRNVTLPPPARSCPGCGRSFAADRRRIWCSDACRQRGFRLRRQPANEAPLLLPRRLPKDVIVYVCPECETRYLGTQRCENCGAFCRRLGPGAPCPHCDEPVALSDLVTETTPTP